MRDFLFCLILLIVMVAETTSADAKRLALVIGNNEYKSVADLKKAINDARAVGKALEKIGYTTKTLENLDRRMMNRWLQKFTSEISAGDEVLFYFAGHGIEIRGRNFLLPTDIPDATPGQEEFVKSEAFSVDEILDRIRNRGARVSILILDACRDNPFPRKGTRSLGGSRGLSRIIAPEGTFIIYSAAAGRTALDRLNDFDPNPNSVFTRRLIPLLQRPGITLTETARQLRREVKELASKVSHIQRPAYYDELTKDYYIAGETPSKSTNKTPSQNRFSEAERAWKFVQNSNNVKELEIFIQNFPNGFYAGLAQAKLEKLKQQTSTKQKKVARLKPKNPVSKTRSHRKRPSAPGERCATDHRSQYSYIYCVSSVLPTAGVNKSNYGPQSLFDQNNNTAWVEGKTRSGNHGVGEWIVVDLKGRRTIRKILIKNGYAKSERIYRINSRVRSAELNFSGGQRLTVNLEDKAKQRFIQLRQPIQADWVQLKILSVNKGTKYSDTAINEFSIIVD